MLLAVSVTITVFGRANSTLLSLAARAKRASADADTRCDDAAEIVPGCRYGAEGRGCAEIHEVGLVLMISRGAFTMRSADFFRLAYLSVRPDVHIR